MKSTLSTTALALAALLAGTAMAADQPRGDGPRGILRADTNGDGKVSKEEATALDGRMPGEWFDKTDLDKDGYVTQEEMRQMRETRKGEMKTRMEERFKEADANSDGQISLDEAQAKMPRLAERFNTLDADKNGLLSKDELKRHAGRQKPQG